MKIKLSILFILAVCFSSLAQNATDLNIDADKFMKQHEYLKALAAYQEAEKLDPNNYDYHKGYLYALFALKRFDEVLADLDKQISINPNNYNALQSKVQVLNYLNRIDEARPIVDEINKILPSKLMREGITLYTKGNYVDSIAKFDASLKYLLSNDKHAKKEWIFDYKAKSLAALNRFDEALQTIDIAINLTKNSNNSLYLVTKGHIMFLQGKNSNAIALYDEALANSNPSNRDNIFYLKANALAASDEKDLALKNYEEAISYNPANIDALKGKALLLEQAKDCMEVKAIASKILKLDPTDKDGQAMQNCQ